MGSTGRSDVRRRGCPICGREVTPESHGARRPIDGAAEVLPAYPFCSERCRLIDLGRWLGEGYRIPDKPSDS
jgi:endogenous inhibitor of DNA gyrase (YacG/DUF329 family)